MTSPTTAATTESTARDTLAHMLTLLHDLTIEPELRSTRILVALRKYERGTPRRVIVEASRHERCDLGDAFARGRETLPGSLTMLRVWWENSYGDEVRWSDDSVVCTKWEFEEMLADAQSEQDLGAANALSGALA